MGRESPRDHIKDYIDNTPDDKLTGTLGDNGHKVYHTTDYCLDMQGTTTPQEGTCIRFNLQVQVNKGCKKRSVAKLAPDSVAFVKVPVDGTWTPERIRQELRASVTGGVVKPK